MGTQQSGILNLKIADLAKDGAILQIAREKAQIILNSDPKLDQPQHALLKTKINSLGSAYVKWSKIS